MTTIIAAHPNTHLCYLNKDGFHVDLGEQVLAWEIEFIEGVGRKITPITCVSSGKMHIGISYPDGRVDLGEHGIFSGLDTAKIHLMGLSEKGRELLNRF